MTIVYHEIAVTPSTPQVFSTTLSGVSYTFRMLWRDNDEAGWVLDIFDIQGEPLVCGIAVITGFDLLMPYKYLGFTGCLVVLTDGDQYAPPTFESLGDSSHLYYVTGP